MTAASAKKSQDFTGDNVKVLNYGLKKEFEDRYDHNALLVENRLTKEQIAEDVCGLLD